ncbi:MAG: urate hydroxylase PuuD [Gammaproteobacteria bacterium]|nr:urate hydroxylase PuuD [Gammaproteobacteria bacterium]
MNPLTSVKGTIVTGFVLAILVAFYLSPENSSLIGRNLSVWLHALFGVTWVGLLYYFNFVQVPAMGEALADEGGPGPAAIGKYIAPKALLWFRMSAAATWLTGAWALSISPQYGFVKTFLFNAPAGDMMSLGAWLGTIMLFNVWVLIWPNQQKILGMVEASTEEIAKAKFTAAMASRTNVVLSVPMLLCMIGAGHGGYLF